MKNWKLVFLIPVAIGGGLLQASTPASIGLTKGGNPAGYITDSSPTAIKFAVNEGGNASVIRLSDIRGSGLDKAIRLEERSEILNEGRLLFDSGEYLDAAKEFSGVVGKYGYILSVPQNFASEAMFYQLESLRRIGRYDLLDNLLKSKAGKSIDTVLTDRYAKPIKMIKLWAIYGSKDWDKLENALKVYQTPVVGSAELLPAPSFKKMPPSELIQVAYMRAKLFEEAGKNTLALQDYGRVFSFTYANEEFLSKQAMGAAMVIMAQDPNLESPNEKAKNGAFQKIQSVAYFFKKRFPNSPLPDQFQQYAIAPEVKMMAPPKVEEPVKKEPEVAKEEPVPPAIAKLIAAMDTNEDGKVSKAEWLNSPAAKKLKRSKKNQEWKARDKDSSGFLEASEFTVK